MAARLVTTLHDGLWPVALSRTEAVLGVKLPSAPKVLQANHFALHTEMADPSGNFATRGLSTRTESAMGQLRALALAAVPPRADIAFSMGLKCRRLPLLGFCRPQPPSTFPVLGTSRLGDFEGDRLLGSPFCAPNHEFAHRSADTPSANGSQRAFEP